jgi:hypothetical protein
MPGGAREKDLGQQDVNQKEVGPGTFEIQIVSSPNANPPIIRAE